MGTRAPNDSPAWLLELDRRSEQHLEKLLELPLVAETNRERMRYAMLQAGVGIVEPFRHWLTNMKQPTQPGTPAHDFLAENEEEETLHWEWWIDMAAPYGLRKQDFADVTLSPQMRELSDFLRDTSRSAPLPVAIAAVNYCIETAAAQMTAAVSEDFAERLGERAGLWVRAHREGDVEHSRIARELLATLTAEDPALQGQAARAALRAYELFYSAMAEALPVAAKG